MAVLSLLDAGWVLGMELFSTKTKILGLVLMFHVLNVLRNDECFIIFLGATCIKEKELYR